MTTPIVLFTSDVRDFDGYTWHSAPSTYLEAVLDVSGGLPVILSAFGPRLDLDGLAHTYGKCTKFIRPDIRKPRIVDIGIGEKIIGAAAYTVQIDANTVRRRFVRR